MPEISRKGGRTHPRHFYSILKNFFFGKIGFHIIGNFIDQPIVKFIVIFFNPLLNDSFFINEITSPDGLKI